MATTAGTMNIEKLEDADLMTLRTRIDSELRGRAKAIQKKLASLQAMLGDEAGPGPSLNGRAAAPKKTGGAGGAKRARASAGKNDGLTVGEAVHAAIKSEGGKADGSSIRAWFAKQGDERTVNLSMLESQNIIKRVGNAKRLEGQKGKIGGIYAAHP